MDITKLYKRFLFCLLALTVASLPFSMNGSSAVLAKGNADLIRLVRTIEDDKTDLSNPVGLAFSSKANAFHVTSGHPTSNKVDIFKLNRFTRQDGLAQIAAAIQDPINIVYDNKFDRLIILQTSANQLLTVRASSDGNLDQKTLTRYDIRNFGLQNPQGMTINPHNGWLYILDGSSPRIVCIEPRPDESFDGAVVSEINLQPSSIVTPRGLAFDPTTGNLHLINPSEQKLYELTTTGQVKSIRDLSNFSLKSPQGMVFAPSGDQTDDSQQMSLYLADSSAGQILEFSLTPTASSAGFSYQTSLVRTTDMSTFSPPSPDPSGVAYLPLSNTLLMSDGEVEETVSGITHFQGVNVWEMTLNGNVVHTANISTVAPTFVPMTDEPTGVAWNPTNGHYLFSSDNDLKIFDLNPGNDGQLGNADDSWTSFGTSAVGSGDPEGIAFDTWRNRIFVVDGTNAEVYEFTTTGIPVGHFDVQQYGVTDPESVEFNPENGNLFVLSNASASIIVETTTSGALLQTIDVSASHAIASAGLAYAPASDGSGTKHFYIVDRAIDNNANPNIIDGKMFELTAPVPNVTVTPTFATTGAATASMTSTFTSTITPSPTIPSSGDLIFSDNFENGNLSAWSASATNGGNLSVQANAALAGSLGLNVNILNNTAMYLADDSPVAETHYRARFYFDPNSIVMASGDSHNIFTASSGSPVTTLIRAPFYYSASTSQYKLQMQVRDDAGTWFATTSVVLSDAPHIIELEWQAASAIAANDGRFVFWLDGTLISSITGLDNDTRQIEQIRLGPSAGVNTGTRGVYYLDAFESRRFSYIGPVAPPTTTPMPTATNPTTATFTPTSTFTLTSTATQTSTSTNTLTASPIYTLTHTITPVPTNTYTPTATVIYTDIPTATNTSTPTYTPTLIATATDTATLTTTSTFTPTHTPSLTATTTNTATSTATFTFTPSHTSTPTDTLTPLPDPIFADGFEGNNLSTWSSAAVDGGDLSTTSAAALMGQYGLQAVINDNNSIYVRDNTPAAETSYRARFYFDPNSILMATSNSHLIFRGFTNSGTAVFHIELRISNGKYQMRVGSINDTGALSNSSWTTVTDAPHFIEIYWQASAVSGANNGSLTFWLDGVQKANLTGTDNDTRRIDYVLLGAVSGIDTGTRGAYYFDEFVSQRFNYIGPVIP